MSFSIGGIEMGSRLLLGTGKFSSNENMVAAIKASGTEMVTVALKRVDAKRKEQDELLAALRSTGVRLLPNTSGVRTADEAVFAAELAREALETDWLKLEIHPDPKYLLPDPIETLKATEVLAKKGFKILPYIHADPVLCKRLEEVGTTAVMPLGAPIGTNLGIKTKEFIEIIIDQAKVPVIVDAGIGAPSDAALALELGADAVLVNTAIAVAGNPAQMGEAFKLAVASGELAYKAKLGPKQLSKKASASSPLTSFLDV
ncbi:thiazole synthase [Luteibaculum oceani]|uniref:Thiazole synthase n=1 Tax=Luteibaculum oceani TaxID=1294296 RepID=A0A5C6V0E8_9FLAO|nr:thiazole synthase [Luteibaculum oceani]TXC78649.1 thiazole synthase [Luteibaculum oceani]